MKTQIYQPVTMALALITAAGVALPGGALAFGLTIGLTTGVAPVHEGAKEVGVSVAPVIRPQFGQRPATLQGRLAQQWAKPLQYGPSFGVVSARDGDSPNATVALLTPVDTALELGGYLGTGLSLDRLGLDDPGVIAARVAARHDVLGGHGGFIVTPSVHLVRPFGQAVAGALSLSGSYASSSYVDSYFDISAGDAVASGLSAYDASAGFKDTTATAGLTFEFAPKWAMGLETSYRRLLGSVADSPVVKDVGSAHQISSAITFTYRWDVR